jgi:hypothetical protein
MNAHNRVERYVDFDQMEYTPEIASALDIYADEMTTHSGLQPMLNIRCSNEEIKAVLDSLYHNILNVEHNLFGWCRSMCKYGDYFMYLDIDEKFGIKSVIGMPSNEVERLEGEDDTNPNYVQYQWNTAGLTLENWQVAHFRILGNDKYAPYGTSILEPARRIFRQLVLMEDAMMAYRIVRSPERRVVKVDVGQIPPNEVEQYMQKVISSMKRNTIVDESTGRVDLRYNPLSVEEDYYIPVRGESKTDIASLPGGTFTGDIDDVKYLRDKLFSALKIPASYLTNAEGADEDKTTLAQKDVRFARTIQRLQRPVVSELEKMGIVHLYTLGYSPSLSTTHPRSRNYKSWNTGTRSSPSPARPQKVSSPVVGLPRNYSTCPTTSSFVVSARSSTTASLIHNSQQSPRRSKKRQQPPSVAVEVSEETKNSEAKTLVVKTLEAARILAPAKTLEATLEETLAAKKPAVMMMSSSQHQAAERIGHPL